MDGKVIKRKGQALLVEIMDDDGFPSRVIVPARDYQGEHVDLSEEEIDTAIPYGIQWHLELADVTISAEEMISVLRRYNMWTFEDYRNDPRKVLAVVNEIARPILIQLNSIAKKYGG